MNPAHHIQPLIEAGAWIQVCSNGHFGARIALGAAQWIEGRGLLIAELGAEHQGHVHLIESQRMDWDGPGVMDAYTLAGGLVATISPMSGSERAEAGLEAWLKRIQSQSTAGDAWRRFWDSEVSNTGKEQA
jgi:hypothetical protein